MSEETSCGFKGCLNLGRHEFSFPYGPAYACDEHKVEAARLQIEAREDLNLDTITGDPIEVRPLAKRTDVHRPSAIVPEDYVFVGCEHVKIESVGDVYYAQAERERIKAHMARTGGDYSRHEHGGNCHVCGTAFAIYTLLYYHAKTNAYVRMGQDCAEKVDLFGPEAFRHLTELRDGVKAERIYRAGKVKAEQTLSEIGLEKAYEIFSAGETAALKDEEQTVRSIVGKLVLYGSISEKQVNFLRTLLDRIARRPEIEAKRAAEAAAAEPVPVTDKRVHVRGTVITLRAQEGFRGVVTKVLVKTEAGYKLWGSLPSILEGHGRRLTDDGEIPADPGAQIGDVIEFDARIERSQDDPKFGFFSRPTKPAIVAKKGVVAE